MLLILLLELILLLILLLENHYTNRFSNMDTIKNWLLTSIGCVGFFLNLIIIIKFLKKQQRKRKKLDLIIVNLALADICFCLGVITAFTVKLSRLNVSEQNLLIYWNISQGLSFSASLLHIMLISVDRLIGVVHPLLYRSGYISRTQLNVVLVFLWLLSGLIASTQFWLELFVIDIIVSVLITVALIGAVVIYTVIGFSLLRSAKKLTEDVRQNESLMKRKVRGICLCFLLTISFFACNMPFVIANIYYYITSNEWTLNMAYVNYFLLTINCSLDPIYYYMHSTLAKWLRQLLQMMKKKSARSESERTRL